MSREHFVESHLEDRVNELIYNENLSEEDAIQTATSEHDGQVNLVEDKALKIHEEQTEILKKLRQGLYPSEIVLSKVVKLLQDGRWKHTTEIKDFNNLLLRQIDDWEREIANTELTNRGEEID